MPILPIGILPFACKSLHDQLPTPIKLYTILRFGQEQEQETYASEKSAHPIRKGPKLLYCRDLAT